MSSSFSPADPDALRSEIDALLQELSEPGNRPTADSTADKSRRGDLESAEDQSDACQFGDERGGVELARRAQILDRAHELLVRALATVDTI